MGEPADPPAAADPVAGGVAVGAVSPLDGVTDAPEVGDPEPAGRLPDDDVGAVDEADADVDVDVDGDGSEDPQAATTASPITVTPIATQRNVLSART